MCGRYRIKDPELFREYVRQVYGIEVPEFGPRYNIAPSQLLPVIAGAADAPPHAAQMRWGFVPFWEKADKPKFAPINARAEDAFAKPMFRQAIQQRRCLVPADGFYEWRTLPGGARQPFDIQRRDHRPFFFAGIYESPAGPRPANFLLFTTTPNQLMAPVHDRMPAILTEDAARRWIAPGAIDTEEFKRATTPLPADELELRPVSTLVNSPRNDGPECIAGPDDLFAGELGLEPPAS